MCVYKSNFISYLFSYYYSLSPNNKKPGCVCTWVKVSYIREDPKKKVYFPTLTHFKWPILPVSQLTVAYGPALHLHLPAFSRSYRPKGPEKPTFHRFFTEKPNIFPHFHWKTQHFGQKTKDFSEKTKDFSEKCNILCPSQKKRKKFCNILEQKSKHFIQPNQKSKIL